MSATSRTPEPYRPLKVGDPVRYTGSIPECRGQVFAYADECLCDDCCAEEWPRYTLVSGDTELHHVRRQSFDRL
jgi:hypothetical protein